MYVSLTYRYVAKFDNIEPERVEFHSSQRLKIKREDIALHILLFTFNHSLNLQISSVDCSTIEFCTVGEGGGVSE